MRCLGVGATARASVGVYNDQADIDALVDALLAGREVFGLGAE
jgi:selenocysteine lyase/cysteine desulfurase